MIIRTTLRGPAGGKKAIIGNDKMGREEAVNSLRMDIDIGFKIIGISDTNILLEFYEGAKYTMGTHIRYEGPKLQMKALALLARTFETITAAAA